MKNFISIPGLKKRIPGIVVILSGILIIHGCSGNNKSAENNAASNESTSSGPIDTLADKGIGPITSVEMSALNSDSATKGETLFKAKCSACHKIDARLVGPALMGVTHRRSPEWIMNQILNPAEQDTKDPIGHMLLSKYMTQMTFQNVTQAEARDILEYFRSNDASK
ncbi:MAG: c-type cytochrome [Bacteroidia bacterium]